MNNKSFILFIGLIAFTIHMSYGQVNKRQAQLITLVGDDYYQAGQYENAIYYYQGAFAENPQYVKAQFMMAQCYRLLQQYDSAEHHYRLIQNNEQAFRYPLAQFYLATLELQNGDTKSASKNFKEFRALLLENEQHELPRFSEYYQQAQAEIDNIGSN